MPDSNYNIYGTVIPHKRKILFPLRQNNKQNSKSKKNFTVKVLWVKSVSLALTQDLIRRKSKTNPFWHQILDFNKEEH